MFVYMIFKEAPLHQPGNSTNGDYSYVGLTQARPNYASDYECKTTVWSEVQCVCVCVCVCVWSHESIHLTVCTCTHLFVQPLQ